MPRGFAICVVLALFAVGPSAAADTDAVVPEELVQDLSDASAVKNCELVVEDCFASPRFPAAAAWSAPAASFSKNYNALCSDEAAVKAKNEKMDKKEAAAKREVANKNQAAERASKVTETRAKEAARKMEKNAKINERNTKEASVKNTEKEEKLFTQERQGKEVANKKNSEIASKTTIVPAPVPVPVPVQIHTTHVVVPKAPAPVPVPIVETNYACDEATCKCVAAAKGPFNELAFCDEMCATTPNCTPSNPVPAPAPQPVIPDALLPPPPPPIGSAMLPVTVVPVIPVSEPTVDTAEIGAKSLAAMKEKLIKSREKFTKTQDELKTKNQKSALELSTKESAAKAAEAKTKESTTKEAKSKVKPVIVKQRIVKVPQHSVEWDIEKGVKKITSLREKLVKAKAAGRAAIKESYSKHRVVPVKSDKCAVTHQICAEIHAASVSNLAKAGVLFDKRAAQLEANCAKTAAFEEHQAGELKFAVCQAAASKMKDFLHRIGSGYIKRTVVINNTTLY